VSDYDVIVSRGMDGEKQILMCRMAGCARPVSAMTSQV
jgi:hypothetical protein